MNDITRKTISLWLLCGVVMIYVQIVIGGITRLTGSGLSITKWEIITGTIPPLTAEKWNQEFDKYKATPQYQKLNEGMSVSEFKFIYFWEYFHRLWARAMGFVFAIPFAVFLYQKKLSPPLIKNLIILVLLAALVASFGWLMVKSGLVDRPWVDAYKLTLHLSLAIITYGYCFWIFLTSLTPSPLERGVQSVFHTRSQSHFAFNSSLKIFSVVLLTVLSFQLILGGLMSGMRAGLLYPTFPDMNGKIVPEVLLSVSNWNFDAFLHYDTNTFAPALVQFVHRLTAYFFTLMVMIFYFKARKAASSVPLKIAIALLPFITLLQVFIGILTVLNFRGDTPVLLGVFHQAVAILLLTNLLLIIFILKSKTASAVSLN